jgi:hypothetical protein
LTSCDLSTQSALLAPTQAELDAATRSTPPPARDPGRPGVPVREPGSPERRRARAESVASDDAPEPELSGREERRTEQAVKRAMKDHRRK